MKLEQYFINMIDLPEILPFTISETKEVLERNIKDQEKSNKKLFEFVDHLEKKLVPPLMS